MKMRKKQRALWKGPKAALVPVQTTTPAEIAKRARQLAKREIGQIVSAFDSGHYEMACTFVWSRAMSGLRRQLATLGVDFIGEMLQKQNVSPDTDITQVVTEYEAILLAEDLGMVNSTEAMRLRHAYELVHHFAERDPQEDETEEMNPEEAVMCLRTCVTSVLGLPKLQVARGFAEFRKRLEHETFDDNDEDVVRLSASPYFYQKTTLSVVLALLKTATGAQLEHVGRNALTVVKVLWQKLKGPERWRTGQTYAELHSEGKRKAVGALKRALVAVSGFDYVPENLRSSTFIAAANAILEAHDGLNNYYNEPGPMRTLASLGTAIPNSAFPVCMTATLAVRLGNDYGDSWAAQPSAERVLKAVSKDRWTSYVNECLPADRRMLLKLMSDKPRARWMALVEQYGLKPAVAESGPVKRLLTRSKGAGATIRKAAWALYERSRG